MNLTAHPLQRIGAFALACLAAAELPPATASGAAASDTPGTRAGFAPPDPTALDGAGLDAAVAAMTADAVRAATGRDTRTPAGFFLKCSLSLFPNSPMAHPSNARRTDEEIAERVRAWRAAPPTPAPTASVTCILCGQLAVGWYGKMDVPLAESSAYRNTTPRGHEGTALCRPCLCSFHALPYGSWLTGGASFAIHSLDDDFLASTVAEQVATTRRVIEIGAGAQGALRCREVLALRALRGYPHLLTAGVELLVYSNNNRGPTFEAYQLDQALAEWLRRTMRRASLRRGYRALLRAHRSRRDPGHVELARTVFRAPHRLPGRCANHLVTSLAGPRSTAAAGPTWGPDPDERRTELVALARLCHDYAEKVMSMDGSDLEEIRATGRRIASLFDADTSGGRLRRLRSMVRTPAELRSWLHQEGVEWVLRSASDQAGAGGPLVTTRGFALLFDPDFDNPGWFHRQLLLVSVVEELASRGWHPAPGGDQADEDDDPGGTAADFDRDDDAFAGDSDSDSDEEDES